MADFTARCSGLKDQYNLITEEAKEYPLRNKVEKLKDTLAKQLELQLAVPDDAKDYKVLADLQLGLNTAEEEGKKIGLSKDSCDTFLDRVQSLISELGAVCSELLKKNDFGSLGAYGAMQNKLRALKTEGNIISNLICFLIRFSKSSILRFCS